MRLTPVHHSGVALLIAALGCSPAGSELGRGACLDGCDDVAEGFSSEDTVLDRESELREYFEAHGERGSFVGKPAGDREMNISYVAFRDPNPVAAIVIVQGRAETYLKYAELVYDLRDFGFSLYMLDHRGQGFSTRELDDPLLGYVDTYDDYNRDLEIFLETVVLPDQPPALFGLSHSMGGMILATHARNHPQAAKDPLAFDAMVLASPMFGLVFPAPTNETIALAAARVGLAKSAVWPYDDYTEGFEDNEFTTSKNRYEFSINRIEEWSNEETRVRAPTNNWLVESIYAIRALRETAADIDTPIRILQALDDQIAADDDQDEICDQIAADSFCEVIRFPGAKHELFQAPDGTRTGAIISAMNFFAASL